ncbi:MAG: HAMP domain-containing protein [Planctomycetia bacterium]|nr:HAMP domain-containing protein [Planctomycetia bacterium]
MWSSRLFWKLFLSYAGLNLLSAAAFVLIVTGRYEARLLAQVQQSARDGRPAAIVAGSASDAAIREEIASMRRLIWTVSGTVSLAVLVLTWWAVARITSPVQTLNAAAQRIAAGDYDQRIYVSNRDELGQLGDSFNRMSQQMSTRVAQLRQSSQRLETVLEGMIEGVLAVDDRQRILFANDAAGRLLGFSPQAAVGRPLLETVRHHALHQAMVEALLPRPASLQNDAAARPTTRRLELILGTAPQRVLATRVARLPGNPCPGVIVVLDDVTDLRRLENLRRDFVTNVSHELKTPLSSIKAYAETLLAGALDDPEHRQLFVARIDEQADRLHQLIQDMLSLARIESGTEVHQIVPVPLAELIDQCLSHHRPAAEAKQIALGVEPVPELLQVVADREGLREIFDNLVDNALKYTPAGGRVTVRTRRDNGQAVIEVDDTGIGIAEEDQPRVFERFYRVDRARSREMGGTGLGLAIVKHLAQAFGGTVSLKSTPGRGSTFSVRLRVAEG